MTCPSCGTNVPEASRFCPQCGHAADPSLETMTSPDSASNSDSFDHGRFAPGTRLGDRYRIVGRLGVGGMGEVYRADDLKLGQPVALKFLPEALERDSARLDQLMVEIRTARQISHPNVCRVYDVGEWDGRRFLTMEYVDGEDLRGLLRRIGRFPEDKGLEIARQICAGLAAIHDRGVLHRDLKPANVMLDGRGRVRLTDFGLATTAAAAEKSGEIAGTPAYMAPEQLAGKPLSVATDIYALGLVLFELFTGERVHKSDRLEDARAGLGAATATLATSSSATKLDPVVQRVIERCLDPDPARRPQSAIVVAAALPGGDPLAAALAAGETPSPQMVAAAGESGGLSYKVAVPLLIALVIGVVCKGWMESRAPYLSHVSWTHSPEVLASKAQEMLGRLGYTEPVADRAWGFREHFNYSSWVNEHDKSPARWEHVASVRPPPLGFWYRTSPRAFVPLEYFGQGPGGGVAVTRSDPPMVTAGMTMVELDPGGRLVSLDVALGDVIDATKEAVPPDWPALFKEAGLDLTQFASVTPEWISRADSDASAAWTGPGADETGAELRVEAAAFRGRPVFFRLIGPWSRPANTSAASTAGSNWFSTVLVVFIVFGIPVTAIGLSLRNVRLKRTDTRGATRVAVAVGGVALVGAILGSHFWGNSGWMELVFLLASWAAFSAALVWTFYAALEPYARRRWPQMLISWSRLLDGRWRDPLVGRDLLVGSVIGVGLGFTFSLDSSIRVWRGGLAALGVPSTNAWHGVPLALADLLRDVPEALWVALGISMWLVIMRLILRSERAAAIAVVLIFGAGLLTEGNSPVRVLLELVRTGTIVVVATRYGLLMLTALFLPFLSFEISGGGFAAPAFAMGGVLLTMAGKVALGVFGFFTATRGRTASAWLDE